MTDSPSTNTLNSTANQPKRIYDTQFAKTLTRIRQALKTYLAEDSALSPRIFGSITETEGSTNNTPIEGPGRLWEAIRYSSLNNGKLIRPVLIIEACKACGGETDIAMPTACAVELVHTQSLIHDDLPCMDDDDLRRGKPTVHKAFNESTAVLTGDALLAMAFGLISRHTPTQSSVSSGASNRPTAERLLSLLTDLSDVSSTHGLVNGQYVDIYYENRPFNADVLNYIHTYKTGALFKFSARAGAITAGASDHVVKTLTEFGEKIGLAFQIIDDLLDIQSTSEVLGKTAGKDAIQNKATYPALYGMKESQDKANQLIEEGIAKLQQHPASEVQPEALIILAEFMRERIN